MKRRTYEKVHIGRTFSTTKVVVVVNYSFRLSCSKSVRAPLLLYNVTNVIIVAVCVAPVVVLKHKLLVRETGDDNYHNTRS